MTKKDKGKPQSSKDNDALFDEEYTRANSLPSKEDVLAFIQSSSEKVGKRELVKAFGIKGGARIPFKRMLREMTADGMISGERKKIRAAGALPPVGVLIIEGRDEEGDDLARPQDWDEASDGPVPKIIVQSKPRRSTSRKGAKRDAQPAAGQGDKILARLHKLNAEDDGADYKAEIIKLLSKPAAQMLGIYRLVEGRGGLIAPIDRKSMREWPVSKGDENGAEDGELVRFEAQRAGRFGNSKARIVERLGNPSDQRAISLIAIYRHEIPHIFPPTLDAELEALKAPSLDKRTDLRDVPLITIDPPDARDHDDAVWAAPDDDPENPDGWQVIVAIADVSHYVRAGSALDREALKRGNSVYFPDRVVPMLPEKISNDLCSLVLNKDRPCLAVRMIFDKDGKKKHHDFMRAIMRSHAKLSYLQAQKAIDGQVDDITQPLLDNVLKPLWAAYSALKREQNRRAPLELDLPERKIILNEDGFVKAIHTPERLTAHRLIEEFMIQANIAAAETLERLRMPVIYRVHDAPSREKIINLGEFLDTLGLSVSRGNVKPQQFNSILAKTRKSDVADLVSEVILRSQSQAEYSPDNIGHFGLNLRRYAHFTSPIRRYADLIIHRALIRACKLGAGGLSDEQAGQLPMIAEDISDYERRAMAAERETVDRLIAAYLEDKVGAEFAARISGVTRSGLFVRLADTGADGFIPISTLGRDYFVHDEANHSLRGERSGIIYQLGDQVSVRLVEAVPSAGALRFEMLSDGETTNDRPERKRHRSARSGKASRGGKPAQGRGKKGKKPKKGAKNKGRG